MADLIVINSKIWTGKPEQPFAEAMAISGDTILAVGSQKDIEKYKFPDTQILDHPGALIVPGFIDSHLHFLTGGFSLSSVQLKDAATKEEFIKRIKDFAGKMNPDEWILEGFWDHKNWGGELPSRFWIDKFTKNNPVFVSRSDGHMALANTAALKVAGITRNTKDVDGGEIERDAKGNPTGIFKDNAMSLVSQYIPDYSETQYSNALDAAMNYVSEQGVTSVHHMGTLADFEVFKTKQNSGKLKTRIYATAPLWQYKKILERKAQLDSSDPWLKLNGAKIFADGSLGSKTAAFTAPYLDDPDETGLLMDDPAHMLEGILLADKAGLQIVIHAIGDRANHFILDFYEQAIKENGPRDRRSRIEHAQHLLPGDVARFGELGVIASMQPWHLMDDGRWAEKSIGHERAKTTFCFRSLLDNGATLAFGSDWFVAPPIPLEGIYAAITRHTLDGSHPDGWIPEEKITLEEALKAYTLDAAYASFEEDIKGSLETGKLADFVILDQDLFSIDADDIIDVKVLSTYIGGQMVFGAGVTPVVKKKETDRLRFIFITCIVDEAFFIPLKSGMEDAARMMDVDCSFTGTEGVDIVAQAELVRHAIKDGYDGIALNIIDPEGFDAVAHEAAEAGIPLIAFNIDDHSTPNDRLSTVSQNFYEAGKTMGLEAAKFIPDGSEILMTMHSAGVSALDDRLHGAQFGLKEAGRNNVKWKVVITGNTASESAEVITRELHANPQIKYILSTGQADTEGAGTAIEKDFANQDYKSAGFDLSRKTLKNIMNGYTAFTIDQQPYTQGFYPVIQLTLLKRYGIMPSNIDAGAAMITRENAESVLQLTEQNYR